MDSQAGLCQGGQQDRKGGHQLERACARLTPRRSTCPITRIPTRGRGLRRPQLVPMPATRLTLRGLPAVASYTQTSTEHRATPWVEALRLELVDAKREVVRSLAWPAVAQHADRIVPEYLPAPLPVAPVVTPTCCALPAIRRTPARPGRMHRARPAMRAGWPPPPPTRGRWASRHHTPPPSVCPMARTRPAPGIVLCCVGPRLPALTTTPTAGDGLTSAPARCRASVLCRYPPHVPGVVGRPCTPGPRSPPKAAR